ncbi:MAG: sulfotransferase family protein [Bacteroidia bacterium]|nr:sulfotransferase family protein [Bacteroidia bacterium]
MSLRIHLWSGPRNISTALMYSFAQRPDTRVVDEPLYAHYLRLTDAPHPGKAAVLASQNPDGAAVLHGLTFGPAAAPVMFYKQMAHHLVGLDESLLLHATNVLLIRDPAEVLASFSQVIGQPTLRDIGILRQYALYESLAAAGHPPVVVSGPAIQREPARMLNALCTRLGIPFEPAMLTWTPGPRPEDGVWAPWWYAAVHASSGFEPYQPREVRLPAHLQVLADEARPVYEKLMERGI